MNPRLRLIADRQGGIFSRRQALDSGYTPRQVADRLADRRWERIRHGQYAESLDLDGLPAWDRDRIRHVRAIHAVINSLRVGKVAVSHQSAIAVHGLPLWGLDLDLVHVTRLDDAPGGVVAGVQHHLGVVAPADLAVVGDLALTTVARAVVETACTTSFEAAVVLADAALRGVVTTEELERVLAMIEFWPGGPMARAAVRFASPLSESVGESRLRVLMHQHGLPTPMLQSEFYDAEGFVARVDFHFPTEGTVVEFDGLLKYAGGSPTVLVREKRREDRLRALGLQVVRAEWADFNRPAHLVSAIRQAFTRANPAA